MSAQVKTQTVTSLLAAPSAANFGQAVTLTASVNPPGATGKVTFYDGASILGNATLSNGTASFVTTAVGYGKRSLTALYGGDSNFAVSLSATFAENVTTKPGGALVPTAGTNASAFELQPAALADLNHDGNLDLVATASNGNAVGPATIWVFLGKGDGTFQAPQSYLPGVSSQSVAIADIDMDGNPDLVVTVPSSLETLIGNGDGTFKTGSTILSATDLSVARVADINGDGKADLILLRGSIPGVEIFFGNGDGTFQTNSGLILPLGSFPSNPFVGDVLVGDFNDDSIPDLAVAIRDDNSVTVMIGAGGGTFGSPVVYTSYSAWSLGQGDLNDDGKLDIVVGNIGFPSFDLLVGNGDGTFAPARTISVQDRVSSGVNASISVFDFDGDGHADVVWAVGNIGASVMLGNGDGTFRAHLFFFLFGANGALVAGDLNHDGVTDIVTTGFPASIQPYLGKLSPEFTLVANPNPANAGQDYTLTVTSNRPDATGTITFAGNEQPLGTATLSNGMASITVSQPIRGNYYIDASYSGDAKYAATVVPELYLVVQQPVGISLSVSPNPALPGQLITLTATVSMDVGNAGVAFFDGTTPLNEQTLYSTTATYKTTLAAGTHNLTALLPAYLGLIPTSATVVENVLAVPNGVLLAGPTYTTVSTDTQALARDLNGDGLVDLAVLNTGSKEVSVFLGTGQGTFQGPGQTILAFVPGAMVAAQFNLSSPGDLAVTDPADNKIAILWYYANGTYFGSSSPINADIRVGQQPVAIAAADFNGDGFADVVTANAGSNDVSLLNTLGGPGAFQHAVNLPAGKHPDAVVTADFNNDGKADFAVANRDDNTVMVFSGNGDGTFTLPAVTPVGSGPVALVAGDLNGDGKTDLVAVDGGSNQVTILLGNGDGTFNTSATYAAGTGPSSALLVDLNGDNKLDLAVTAASGLLIFTGNGDGTFSAPVCYPQYAGAASVAAGPFSGDGRMDLVVSLPGAKSVMLIINGTPTTTTLSVTPLNSTMGHKVTLTASVSPATAVGSVAFFDGLTQIGASRVSHGSASFSTTLLFSGAHSLSARFLGGSGYGSSASSAANLQVSPVSATGLSGPIRQPLFANSPANLIPADFNGDGIEDFAFWRAGNGLVVLLGNGDGTFHQPPAGTRQAFGGGSPVTADFNNDGNTDIAYVVAYPVIALSDGTGGFVESFGPPSANAFPASLAVSDFNGDGRPDLVQVNSAGTADVMLGNGDGTFQVARTFPVGTNPVLVATGDFNEDGKADIVVANNTPPGSTGAGALNVLFGNGDGTFGIPQPVTIASQPVSMVLGDFNGDGHLDVAVVHPGTNVASILLGKGDGTFGSVVTYPLGATPAQVLTADMDGDGHPDLIVMFTSAAPAFAVLYGIGDGTFATPVNYPDILPPAAIAVGDVNGDGRMDVILAESESVNIFLGAVGALSILQGSPQHTPVGTQYPVVLAVSAPAGTQVTFTAPVVIHSSPYPGGTFAGGATVVTVTADATGVATAPSFTANAIVGNYIVIASARGVAGMLSFSLTNDFGSLFPSLAIFGTHGGNFELGQNGALYALTVWNTGTAPTTGTVTVQDALPAGLTAVSMTGFGWTCAQPAGPCTRSDALAHFAPYPEITVTVNVSANRPMRVINQASVSGGGSASVFATDPTMITGSGHPDLVLQNKITQQVTVWYMGGAMGNTFLGWNWLDAAGHPGWSVVAIADLNLDGQPDLILQNNTTRQVTVWYMGGATGNTFLGWNWLDAAGQPGWTVAAAADLNGDGHPDLILQNNTTRQVTVWYMGGAMGNTFLGWEWLDVAGHSGWTVVATADLNQDGHPDLILQNNATQQVTVWYMGGATGNTFLGWDWLAAAGPSGWMVAAVADLNQDGHPDLILQNKATQQITVWYMAGPTGNSFLGWNWLDTGGHPGWTVVGP